MRTDQECVNLFKTFVLPQLKPKLLRDPSMFSDLVDDWLRGYILCKKQSQLFQPGLQVRVETQSSPDSSVVVVDPAARLTVADQVQPSLDPWWPISTAPNNTKVLVGRYLEDGQFLVCQSEKLWAEDGEGGYWYWSSDWDYCCLITDKAAPTLWTRLPPR